MGDLSKTQLRAAILGGYCILLSIFHGYLPHFTGSLNRLLIWLCMLWWKAMYKLKIDRANFRQYLLKSKCFYFNGNILQ